MQVSLVTRVFYEAKILKFDQITIEFLEMRSRGMMNDEDAPEPTELWLPSRRECYNVIAQAVYHNQQQAGKAALSVSSTPTTSVVPPTPTNPTPVADYLPAIVKDIVTKYLWFEGRPIL